MESKNKLTFFINPVAGRGNWDKAKKQIDRYCLKNNLDPEYYFTGDPAKIKQVIEKKEKEKVPVIFAVGGDGTINMIARHMIGRDLALGILPLGSGNGLARHLKIPGKISKSVRLIDNHRFLEMDHIRINGEAFFTTAGVGFDAEVSRKFSEAPNRGLSGYIYSFFQVIKNYKFTEVNLRINGGTESYSAFVLAFANASQYGNSAYIAPGACITDGKFETVIVRPFAFLLTPVLIFRLFTGSLNKSKYVKTLSCAEILAVQKTPGHLHFDGEVGEHNGEIHVRIGEGKLKILVPLRFKEKTPGLQTQEILK